MGRKIPAKRHHGVKDPLKQRDRRLMELASKIDKPPKNTDDQATPRSLERVIKLKEALKNDKTRKIVKKKQSMKSKLIRVQTHQPKLPPNAKPDKVIPAFQQNPGEDSHDFYHRVCVQTQQFLKESEFERKFNVQVDRDPDTGEIQGISKCPKDEIDELYKLRAKHKNTKKKKKRRNADDPKLTKYEKRKQKLQLKKEKQQENIDEFKTFKDQVQFGEVVHAPPKLTVAPKNSKYESAERPAARGLLLNSMLGNAGNKMNTGKPLSVDKSNKRKNLSAGERRQLEMLQKNAIAAYRQLKAQRLAASSN